MLTDCSTQPAPPHSHLGNTETYLSEIQLLIVLVLASHDLRSDFLMEKEFIFLYVQVQIFTGCSRRTFSTFTMMELPSSLYWNDYCDSCDHGSHHGCTVWLHSRDSLTALWPARGRWVWLTHVFSAWPALGTSGYRTGCSLSSPPSCEVGLLRLSQHKACSLSFS